MNVIVEAGCNWTTFNEACRFIEESKRIGAFATKFQIFNEDTVGEELYHLILNKQQVKFLFDYGKAIKQEVLFTPFFPEAVDWCEEIGVKYYKIRYKDRNNDAIVNKVKATHKPYFYSTDEHVDQRHCYCLYCVPEYPAKRKDYKYNCLDYMGISDHTKGTKLMKNAWFWFIEKHVKLNGTHPLEDKWSVSFKQLEEVMNNV